MNAILHGSLTLLFCYLLGSILFGLIISECAYGVDIRQFGSGNVGFTNIKRTLGWKPAIAVLLLDGAKGAIAIWISRKVFAGEAVHARDTLILVGGVLAIIGHNWSIFFKFAGGKGVATSLGVLIALDWRVAGLAVLVGFPLLLYPGYMSLAATVGAATLPVWFWLLGDPLPWRIFGVVLLIFVLVRHRANYARIRSGSEPRFSFRGSPDPPAAPQVQT